MRTKYLLAELHKFSRSEHMRALGLQMLAATSVLMVAALILMSVTLSNLKESRIESEATQDTLLEITTIEARLMDFDGTWNNYRVTGNAWFLNRLTDDRNELHGALGKLKHSLRNDPLQMDRHRRIEKLVVERDRLNRYLFDPARRGGTALASMTRAGRDVTDGIRALLWQVLARERAKRHATGMAMIAQAEDSFRIAVGIVLLTFFFGAICLVLSVPPKKIGHALTS